MENNNKNIKNNKKTNNKKEKRKTDIGRIATKIIAAVLAILMVFTVIASLVFYLFI